MQKEEKLSIKHHRFCENIAKGLTEEEAYIEAGYSPNGAAQSANKLLKNPKILNYITEINKTIANQNIAEAAEIQEFLTKQMRGDHEEECVVVESVGNYKSKAKVVKKKITPKDRQKAAETLAKMKGLLKDNMNLNVEVSPIIDDL